MQKALVSFSKIQFIHPDSIKAELLALYGVVLNVSWYARTSNIYIKISSFNDDFHIWKNILRLISEGQILVKMSKKHLKYFSEIPQI